MENLKHTTILIFTISSFLLSLSSVGGSKLSFSVDYIHRDSRLSPYHNSSQTHYDRVRASFNRDCFRSSLRSKDLSSEVDITSRVQPASTEYLMSISLGTPPFQTLAIVDTGSDLIWTQCSPCQNCYKQDLPLFDSNGSSTYEDLSCDAGACNRSNFVCNDRRKCSYRYLYGDGSLIGGVLATDTITFDSSSGEKVSINDMNIGCTQESRGTFGNSGSGIIGLSTGPISLITQLGDKIDNKFSYCLTPLSVIGSSSTFTFGSSTKSSGDSDGVKVPIIPSEIYYYLSLESINIGNSAVASMDNVATSGNIIIDSGTTLTYIPSSVLNVLIDNISKMVTLPTYDDPSGQFQLCYNVNGGLSSGNLNGVLPNLDLDFGNGKIVSLPPLNTFLEISESVVCFAMGSSDESGTSIIGNVAQQNFFIEYDVGNNQLSFTPMDCTDY